MGVKVYTSTLCPKCDTVKRFLLANDIVYKSINVDEQEEERKYLQEQGIKSLPVIFCEKGKIEGLNVPKMKEFLLDEGNE